MLWLCEHSKLLFPPVVKKAENTAFGQVLWVCQHVCVCVCVRMHLIIQHAPHCLKCRTTRTVLSICSPVICFAEQDAWANRFYMETKGQTHLHRLEQTLWRVHAHATILLYQQHTLHSSDSLTRFPSVWVPVRAKWKSRRINKDARVMDEENEGKTGKRGRGVGSTSTKRRQKSTLLQWLSQIW